jgi:hypothetical protein
MKAEDIQKQLDAEQLGYIAQMKAKDEAMDAKDAQVKVGYIYRERGLV